MDYAEEIPIPSRYAISDCSTSGSITGGSEALGSIAGYAYDSTVKNCTSNMTINGVPGGEPQIGLEETGVAGLSLAIPTTLPEVNTNEGGLENGTMVITIENGELAADIGTADVTADNLPVDLGQRTRLLYKLFTGITEGSPCTQGLPSVILSDFQTYKKLKKIFSS